MAQYDGSIRIRTSINSDGIRKGEKDIKASLGRMTNTVKKFSAVIGSAFAIGKITQFGKEVIQVASDFEAMESQFSQVFGNLESKASESLKSIANQTGILEERMKGNYTKIAAFAKTTGLDIEEALGIADRAMIAVADNAAFYDRSLEETTESLQSFLKGNYENDAALGLSATEFTRNAAANKLYGKSFIELSEAQKQLTLLQMVEDANKLSGALGQASREADTWTNQTGNLNQAWTNLKANLGKFILPMAVQAVKGITNVINAINAMISRMSTAAGAFRSFSELLTGKKSSSENMIPEGGSGSMAEEYSGAAVAADNLASSTEKVANATKDAKKAAEGYLSPLDEINKFSKEDKETDSVGSGTTTGAVGNIDYGNLANGETVLDKIGSSFSSVTKKAKELAGLFKKGFFDGLGDYKPKLDGMKSDILSIGKSLKGIFTSSEVLNAAKNFVETFSYSIGKTSGSFFSIGLTVAQNIIGGIERFFSQSQERIKDWIVNIFDIGSELSLLSSQFSADFAEIFSVFGSETAQQITANIIGIFAETFMGITEFIGGFVLEIVNRIVETFSENKELIKESLAGTLEGFESITSSIREGIEFITQTVLPGLLDGFKGLLDLLSPLGDFLLNVFFSIWNDMLNPALSYIGEKVLPILIDTFKNLWNKILVPLGEFLKSVFKPIIEIVSDVLNMLWQKIIVPLAQFIGGTLSSVFVGFCEILNKTVIPIISSVIEVLKFLWNNVLSPIVDFLWSVLKPAFSSVFDAIGGVINGIKNIFSGLIDFITGIFTGNWKKAWEGVKKIFSGIWDTLKSIVTKPINAVLGVFEGLANGIIDGWNWIKKQFNKLSFDIPDWVPVIGGGKFGFNFDMSDHIKIPRLATGTVVPPNREFMAVLGDNKREPEIVSPISSMKQAFKEAMTEMGRTGKGNSGTIIIKQYLDGKQITQAVIKEGKVQQMSTGDNIFALG